MKFKKKYKLQVVDGYEAVRQLIFPVGNGKNIYLDINDFQNKLNNDVFRDTGDILYEGRRVYTYNHKTGFNESIGYLTNGKIETIGDELIIEYDMELSGRPETIERFNGYNKDKMVPRISIYMFKINDVDLYGNNAPDSYCIGSWYFDIKE